MKHIVLLFFFIQALFGQMPIKNKYRETFSPQINIILSKFDSLMCNSILTDCKGSIQSKTVRENNAISKVYIQYIELVKYATEKELLAILDNKKELSAIRGYALMAYIYKCEKEKKQEKKFNYKFNTFIQVGCIGTVCSFEQLNHKVRVRRFYDPNPNKFKDLEEQKAIKMENEIRKEQDIPLRKE